MNTSFTFKGVLAAALMAGALALSGCEAQGDGTGFPGGGAGGGGGGGGGPTDVTNCQVPLGSTLCVLAGDRGGGLVDELLATNGPLGPIAGAIDTTELTNALTQLLENDGTLTSLLQGLLANGQLAEGLQLLLTGVDGSGDSGLAAILDGVLATNDQGQGLLALFGQDGIQGLVMALLVDGTSADCQAPLGTLCLIAGDNTNQVGLVDLLATSEGLLGSLSPTLTTGVTDDVVATLGDMLANDGTLRDLLTGLLAEGQLTTALQVLLVGDPAAGVQSGLVQALQNLFTGLGSTLTEVVDYITGLLGGTAP